MAQMPPIFTKKRGTDDIAFVEGRRPGDGGLQGAEATRFENPIDFAKTFAGRVGSDTNPDFASMYKTDVFSPESAAASQEKLNTLATTDLPPNATNFARNFAFKYSGPGGAIERGLINPEDAVTKEGLDYLIAQEPAASTNDRVGSTVGKFPSRGVAV